MRAKAGGIHYAPPGVSMRPLRWWKSPRTGVQYPVSMQVNDLRLEPLMDDQELDARASTGTIYWEGAVRAFREKEEVGRGYLELTGYWKPMKL
jgi:predicted secreted hydrolase